MDSEKTKYIVGAAVWRYRLLLSASAGLAVVAAIMAGIALWSAPRQVREAGPAAMTASSSPYTDEQVTAAKTDACEANQWTNKALTAVHNALWDTPKGSSEEPTALAAYQRVTLVETEYLKSRTRPEAPESVRSAVNTYIAALLAEVDGVTRGVPVSEKVTAVKDAGAQLDKACREG